MLALSVLGTFALMLAPFLGDWRRDLLQVLHRMFPVARGLFEDKVANFWSASSVLIKWKDLFPKETLVRIRFGNRVL